MTTPELGKDGMAVSVHVHPWGQDQWEWTVYVPSDAPALGENNSGVLAWGYETTEEEAQKAGDRDARTYTHPHEDHSPQTSAEFIEALGAFLVEPALPGLNIYRDSCLPSGTLVVSSDLYDALTKDLT